MLYEALLVRLCDVLYGILANEDVVGYVGWASSKTRFFRQELLYSQHGISVGSTLPRESMAPDWLKGSHPGCLMEAIKEGSSASHEDSPLL